MNNNRSVFPGEAIRSRTDTTAIIQRAMSTLVDNTTVTRNSNTAVHERYVRWLNNNLRTRGESKTGPTFRKHGFWRPLIAANNRYC